MFRFVPVFLAMLGIGRRQLALGAIAACLVVSGCCGPIGGMTCVDSLDRSSYRPSGDPVIEGSARPDAAAISGDNFFGASNEARKIEEHVGIR